MKEKNYNEEILQSLQDCFKENDWKYEVDENHGTIHLEYICEENAKSLNMNFNVYEESFTLWATIQKIEDPGLGFGYASIGSTTNPYACVIYDLDKKTLLVKITQDCKAIQLPKEVVETVMKSAFQIKTELEELIKSNE